MRLSDSEPELPASRSDRHHEPQSCKRGCRNIEIGTNLVIKRISFSRYLFFHTKFPVQQRLRFSKTNFKWKFAANGKLGLAASAGGILVVPLIIALPTAHTHCSTANLSKKMTTGNYGPRFTAGPTALQRTETPGEGRGRGRFSDTSNQSSQRPRSSPTGTVARIRFGYLTSGISFALPGKSSISAGYSVVMTVPER